MIDHRKKLARSPWVSILVAANLLVTLLVFLYLLQAYRSAEEEARIRTQNLVSLIRLHLDSMVGEIDMALRALAEEPVTGPESEARRQKLIDKISRDDPEFRTLVIADADGAFVGGKLAADGKPFNIVGRDYYDTLKDAPNDGMVVSGPLQGRSNGRWSLVFARRLDDLAGRFAGVVLTGYAVDRFEESFAPINLHAFQTLSILKADGSFLVSFPAHPGSKMGAQVPPEFLAAKSIEPREGFIRRLGAGTRDDPTRMAAYERSDDQRFYVMASTRTGQVFAAVYREAAAFLAMLITLMAASLYFARRTLRADRRLDEYQYHLEGMVEARTRELILARDLAESASRAKTAFLANMSHELKTPMNGIMGLTQLVQRHVTDDGDKRHLALALKSADHLLHLINDLLDISKIQAEHFALEKGEFNMASILETVGAVIGAEAAAKKLEFNLLCPAAIRAARFRGDRERIGHILLHLAGNAVKFTANGSVSLSVSGVAESATAMRIKFAVQDTGGGISPEDQKRLFTLFEQLDASTTRRFGGTGLGLALCWRLAELMGGRIEVSSEVGRGSTFTLELCLEKAAAV